VPDHFFLFALPQKQRLQSTTRIGGSDIGYLKKSNIEKIYIADHSLSEKNLVLNQVRKLTF